MRPATEYIQNANFYNLNSCYTMLANKQLANYNTVARFAHKRKANRPETIFA